MANENNLASQIKNAFPPVGEKPAASSGANDRVASFARDMAPIAERVSAETGVDPAVLIGQWGLETGWGKSVIPGTNNFGNIKDFRGSGVTARDNMNGSVDKYRAYESPEDFGGHFAQLLKTGRYKGALGALDAQSYFSALKAGGYAEDPNYVRSGVKAADMVKRVMGEGRPAASIYPERGEYIGQTEKVQERTRRQEAADESPLSTSLGRGFEGLKHNVGLFAENLAGDSDAAAERIRAKREWDEANPAPSSSEKFTQQWQSLAEDDYSGMLGAALSNPGGMLNQMVEQTPNSLPGLALQVPTAIASGALLATGWGAPIAIGLQGLAAFAGNVMPEGGAIIEERLAKSGVNPNDTAAVAKWIADNRNANIEGGVKKAGVISLVDGATGYLGAKMIAGPAVRYAKAEQAALANAGINLSDKASVAAARATPAYKQAMAVPAKELLDATTRAQKTVRELGGVGLETVGEGVGEYAGSYAANGEASVKDAVLESLMGAGNSAAMTGANMATAAMRRPEIDLATLGALAATPVQPVIKQNSPLSNMASVGQAAQANAAAQSNLAIQQQALAEQEAGLDPSQAIVDPAAAAQDAVRRRIMAEQQKAAPQQDYSAAEDAENEIGQATGFEQQDQILEFNRLLAEEQASLAEQRGDIAEAQQIRAAEAANREAIRASRARNRVGKPSGSFGQMNEFADLLSEEQADIESQRAEVAAKQDQQRQTEALRAQSEIESTDARVAAQMAREAEARRRDILGSVIEQGISGVNPVADVAGRFSAELMRQGYRDTAPTDAETQSILRAVDVANAREDGPLPSLPNEVDFYEPMKPPRSVAPKAEPKPKQQPARKLTPLQIRQYIAAGAVLNGDTLTLPDGTTIKLKGAQIAAAREAIRKQGATNETPVVSTPDVAAEVVQGDAQPENQAEAEADGVVPAEAENDSPVEAPAIDVSTRTDDQFRYLATNGKDGWREAAQAELTRREQKTEPAARSEIEHNGVRIYPITINVAGQAQEMWGVESAENKAKREAGERYGFGDYLHDTLDQAKKEADRQRRDDEARENYERKRVEKESADQAAEAGRKADTYNGFLDGKAENTKELIRKALAKQYRFDGVVMTVRERVESLFRSGELNPGSFEEPKIKPMSRTQFNRASQREQDAHEKKMREAGTKTVYTVSGSELGKYAHDYAQHLLTRGTTGEVKAEIRSDLDAAAHEAATSPLNDTPQPTDGQKSAGNYKVGRVRVQGMDISIENPKGSVRSGTSPDGRKWESTLHAHYGYFTGTKAADGDHLDVYLTDGAEDAPMVWVIDQKNADGTFDEHKTLLGPRAEEEAKAAYLANYEPGWDGIGAISSMPIEAFKAWAFDGKKKRKPLVYAEPEVTAAEASDTATAQPDPREAYADQKADAYIAQRGGNAPPKAVEAVRIGARKEFDKGQANSGPTSKYASGDRVVPSLDVMEGDIVTTPDGKTWMAKVKRGNSIPVVPFENGKPIVSADTARRFDLNETVVTHSGANFYGYGNQPRPASADQPTHQDPGQPAEAVTPAVVAKSIQKSARNTEFNPAEAKKWLLGEIDKAVANVPAENAELAAELAREKVKTFDMQAAERKYGKGSKAASSARDSFNALRDSNVAKIAKQIGFVTFDVPGDGKFKVMNTADGLNNFRSKVEKSSGFKAPANKPPVMERETDTGSYTPRDALADGEFLNAYELARLQGKPLRFSVGSGRPNAYTDASDVKGLIPGFKTFVGRKADSSKMPWAVIEESTGLAIGDGGTSKAAAIAAANAKMKGHEQAIADKLKRGGISDAKLQDQLEADWIKWAEEREGRKMEEAEEVAPAADPNPEPTPLDFTPKQYHEARMKWVAQEYGLSDAEVRQDYDTPAARDADNQAWVDAVRQAFKDGTELTRATLDKLEELRPGALLSNLHDYPEARIPAGYQLPSARKAENEASAAKRESKKQIAASFAEGRAKREELTPSDLTNIFAGLSSRGLAKTRAQKAAQAHPRAEQIAYVQDNFLDILTELEDSGIVKINCD